MNWMAGWVHVVWFVYRPTHSDNHLDAASGVNVITLKKFPVTYELDWESVFS